MALSGNVLLDPNLSGLDPGCVKTQKSEKRRECFFSNEPKSNASANPCAPESGFVESPFYRNCAAVHFYTAKAQG
jgi:hypothetical protein